MGWLDIGAGAAHGLDKMLADRLAEEHWQRKQKEDERSNLATETYRSQTLKDAEENRRLQREQMADFEKARQGDRAADNLRAQIGQLPEGTEFSPVRWKEITDKGAALPERGEPVVPYSDEFVGPIQPPDGGMALRPQRGESIIKLRGTPSEVAAARTAKALEDRREVTDHSPIYKEWQDHLRAGGTLSFDAYAKQDANLRTPRPPTEHHEWVIRDGQPVRVSEAEIRSGDAPVSTSRETGQDRVRTSRVKAARGFLSKLNDLRETINTKMGLAAGATGLARQAAAAAGYDPDVRVYERERKAAGRALAVAILGAQNLSDADAEAWADMLPGATVDKETAATLMADVETMLAGMSDDKAPPSNRPAASPTERATEETPEARRARIRAAAGLP